MNALIIIGAVIVLFLIIVAMRPSEFRVARSTTIAAPPEMIFPLVNELKNWEAWNPWGKIDPNMKLTYEGPASGVGAVNAWVGNNKVGEGRMEIIESCPNELIRFKLDFYKPMAGTSIAEFTFKPEGNQTVVTWTMSGKNNFMAKAFGLFVSCDKMIGSQFEKGLTDMKAAAEAEVKLRAVPA